MAKKVKSHAGLEVVKFLGEYRIQGRAGAILGSGSDDNAHFRAAERFLVEGAEPHKDSIGYVWPNREAADTALQGIAKKNLK